MCRRRHWALKKASCRGPVLSDGGRRFAWPSRVELISPQIVRESRLMHRPLGKFGNDSRHTALTVIASLCVQKVSARTAYVPSKSSIGPRRRPLGLFSRHGMAAGFKHAGPAPRTTTSKLSLICQVPCVGILEACFTVTRNCTRFRCRRCSVDRQGFD